ncbi:multi-sensor hybrid histidine kinase [Gloeothece citriformis PCC 7424]|uniref:Circadian input-output histidine kinase CikA n=1 Tax=Gloeothece citriformis (strain PCC 7424) TaxID=65393 RepID=B7K8P7_GLOC7|nr:PAS domain S-box protein [Gloeothece citriformis]ACK71245.1 multi-sensor hybrid histidine kinase [Gloeothece citriformis PCC 7424]
MTWQKVTRSPFFSYGVAVIAVLLAFLIMLMLDPWVSMVKSPFLLFLGAIVISAWYGGLKPGLLASFLSVILSHYFFLEPLYTFGLTLSEGIRIGLYFLQGVIVSLICEALRKAKRQAEVNLLKFKVSEERFRLALSNSNLCIFQQNQDLKYLWIHTSEGQVSPEEIIGKSDYDLFSQPEAQQLTAIKKRAIHSRQPLREEVCLTFGANPHYYELFIQPIASFDEQICGITCVAVDITERKHFEQQLHSATQQSSQILESLTDAFFALDQTWQFTYVNRHFEEISEHTREDLLGECIWDVFPEMRQSVFYEEFSLVFEQNLPISIEAINPINPEQWIEARAYPSAEGLCVYWQDITLRKETETERNQLLEREKTARAAAELMQQRLAFLDTASTILAGSLDYPTTLQTVVNLIVPDLADLCGLDILQEDRSVNPLIALKAKDQQEEELVRHFTRLYPLDLNDNHHPITRVFQTGLPETLYQITDEDYQAIAKDPQHLHYLRQLGMKSSICVPLKAHEEVFGVMTLALTKTERSYNDDDLRLALELGRRVGLAIENSRLHHQLQQATRQQQDSLTLLEAVIQQMPAGLAIVESKTGRIILQNDQLRQILGNRPLSTELLENYHHLYEVYHPNGHPYKIEELPLMRSRQQGEVVKSEEMLLVWTDGTQKTLLVDSSPIVNSQGEIEVAVATIYDITDYKQVVTDLKNRQEQLRLAVEGANLGMWNYDLLSGELIWSNRCKKMFGIAANTQISYEVFINALHPEDRLRVDQAVQHSISQRQNYDIEMRTQWPDGSLHWVRSIGHAYYNNEGVAHRMAGVVLDITGQKQAQEALRKSEERFRVAQELSLDGFTVLKSIRNQSGEIIDFEWTYVNPTAAKILRSQINDLIGKRLLEILPDNQSNSELFKRYVQVVETANSHDLELYYDSDEIVGWFRNMAVKLEDGVAVSFSDITERKQAEETLRENEQRLNIALKTAKLGSWHLDLSTMELFTSAQYKANFGLATDADLSYTTLFRLIHPEDRGYVSQMVQHAINTHTDYEAEYRSIWPDGSIHWINSQGCVLYSNTGIPLRIVGVNLDITGRKQAQEEQKRLLEREKLAREEAERVNRIKDEFLAVLSHELRSPLNPILGWAQLLRSGSFDKANQNKALEIIERNAKLQAQLIEDLLDVSRILRGKLSLNVTQLNLFFPIQGAIETVRLSAQAKSIEIKTNLATDVVQISGDAGRIQQIVWNLLSNAIKFTPEGGQIEIGLEQVNHQAQITVKDSGKGIDPQFLPHVFEHFRQADSTTTRKFGGLGLGLAIVRHLVEMHGGTVSAYSAGENQGSTFIVQFPLLKDQSNKIKPEIIDPFLFSVTQSALKGIRILAVDDDPDMRDYVTYVLEQSGAEVKVAGSANEALNILSHFKPDILLSDVGMPKIDGYRLLRQIRSLFPESNQTIPAIALTAYAGEYNQRQALAAGFERHLSKPVEPEQLIKAIVDLINLN